MTIVWNESRKEQYLTFIESCRDKDYSGKITEIHHIVSRALGGSNDPTNLIRLSCFDHIRAHILLYRACPCRKTLLPIIWMSSKEFRHISEKERETIEQMEEWAQLRQEALQVSGQQGRKNLINPNIRKRALEHSRKTQKQMYGTETGGCFTREARLKAELKRQQTNLLRFGTTAGRLTEDSVIQKSIQTRKERYGRGWAVSEEQRKKALEKAHRTLKNRQGSCTAHMRTPENLEKGLRNLRTNCRKRTTVLTSSEFRSWFENQSEEIKHRRKVGLVKIFLKETGRNLQDYSDYKKA